MRKQERKPKWIAGERFERTARFQLRGQARDVFPLLCPVREYEWFPEWSCKMVYSKSGVAEPDAVFHTREMHALPVVWTLITYEPDSKIEYLMVSRRDAVVRLSILLQERSEGSTEVTWRMLFTATSLLGKKLLPAAFSEEKFLGMIQKREAELNCFLQTGQMIVT